MWAAIVDTVVAEFEFVGDSVSAGAGNTIEGNSRVDSHCNRSRWPIGLLSCEVSVCVGVSDDLP